MDEFLKNSRGGWIVPDKEIIPVDTIVPPFSEFGKGCAFGNGCEFGEVCKFGEQCMFREGCNHAIFGAFTNYLTLTNVDGSRRQLVLYSTDKGVMIDAGCFSGSAKEFCDKARGENKLRYVAIVEAVAAAMAKHDLGERNCANLHTFPARRGPRALATITTAFGLISK